jgi:hypothetical protein
MKKVFIALLMVFFFVAGFSGIVFSGSGPNPGSTCDLLYTNPALTGKHIAGKDASGTFIAWETTGGVIVQVMLKKDKQWHAFEFTTNIGAGLCDPNLTDDELLVRMSLWPCAMDIQQDFFPGLEWLDYFPLLVDVDIKARDCTLPPDGATYSSPPTISGDAKVKLVPLKW